MCKVEQLRSRMPKAKPAQLSALQQVQELEPQPVSRQAVQILTEVPVQHLMTILHHALRWCRQQLAQVIFPRHSPKTLWTSLMCCTATCYWLLKRGGDEACQANAGSYMQTWRLAMDIALLFCDVFTPVSTAGNAWLIAIAM